MTKSALRDGPHEWDDTYNDRVSGEIHGNGDLQSEYYSFERDSEQVQTAGEERVSIYTGFLQQRMLLIRTSA